MGCNHFDLYFGPLKVGVVTQADSDFPNLFGTITYDSALSEPLSAEVTRLARFINLSRASLELVDMEQDPDTSPELGAMLAELETQYNVFIESEDWHLIDHQGCLHPILCPILRWDGEIVWRWNIRGA